MARGLIQESILTDIANAIREKLNTSAHFPPSKFAEKIDQIESGITPTGTVNITQNGSVDVTQYATANVNVQPTGTINITENGTVNVAAYATANVNVASAGLNWQANCSYKQKTATSLSSTGLNLTVNTSGTYKISWCAWRSSSSGTMSTRLYVNGQAKDTTRSTWTNTYGQQVTVSNFSLNKNDVVEIYGSSGSSSRYVMVANLVLEQTA